MATATRTGPYTFEDFCALIPDRQKADLIEGLIYVASPENTDANDLGVWLSGLMYAFAQRKKLGRIFASRVAFRLDDRNGPEPDIGFVGKKQLDRIRRGHVLGPPRLAVEIVSPDSAERDYEKKRRQYEEHGVFEYLIIDEIEKKVVLLRLDARGKYREVRLQKGILRSQAMKGFWLDTAWLWQDPLPDLMDTLQLILSGPR